MENPAKFRYLWEHYTYHIVFAYPLLAEPFIFFYTMQRDFRKQAAEHDHGTRWLLYGNLAVCGRYWNCFCCGRNRDSAQCRTDPENGIYPSCADGSQAAVGHIRSVSYGSSPGLFGKYSKFIRRCFGISEHSCCLPCLFLLPDLLQWKDSSGGKGTGSAVWQEIHRL